MERKYPEFKPAFKDGSEITDQLPPSEQIRVWQKFQSYQRRCEVLFNLSEQNPRLREGKFLGHYQILREMRAMLAVFKSTWVRLIAEDYFTTVPRTLFTVIERVLDTVTQRKFGYLIEDYELEWIRCWMKKTKIYGKNLENLLKYRPTEYKGTKPSQLAINARKEEQKIAKMYQMRMKGYQHVKKL